MHLRGRDISLHPLRSQNDENIEPLEAKMKEVYIKEIKPHSRSSSLRPLRKRRNEVVDPPPDLNCEESISVIAKDHSSVEGGASSAPPSLTIDHSNEVKPVGPAPSAKRRKKVKLDDDSLENHCKFFASSHIIFIGFLDIN